MLSKKIIFAIAVVTLLASCKKTYMCECTNSNGSYDAGETEGTKNQAKKHCESLSSGATTCGLK